MTSISDWLWRPIQEWPKREGLKGRLLNLGSDLTAIKTEYQSVSSQSSRMVGNRIQNAVSEYWQAVDAFMQAQFDRCDHLLSAACLEVDFIRQLIQAEHAERELGGGHFFEFMDNQDRQAMLAKIENSLAQVEVELTAWQAEIRGRHAQ